MNTDTHSDFPGEVHTLEAARADLGWLLELEAEDFLDLLERVEERDPEQVTEYLWFRCRYDLAMFGAVFFGERLPLPYNAFHQDVLARPKVPWTDRRRPQRLADAAPRGNAKSTLESFISLVHDTVYGIEAYVGVLSTTFDLSQDLVKNLHTVFREATTHELLHEVFGPFQVIGGTTDFVVHVPGKDPRGVRFKAFSFGGTVRGTNHAGIRPSKWVVDDGEHPERVRSPEQRGKTWEFLTKDVLKSGDTYTIFRVIGTVLHPDSMLNRVIGESAGGYGLGWTGKRWQSVIRWPTNTSLWTTCRELWADLTDPDREDTARRFYARHKEQMDEGAEVLWKEKEDLYDLHVMLWSDGPAAFNSEKQNIATDPERQVFYPERFKRCRFDGVHIHTSKGRKVHIRDCDVATWLDPRASEEREKNDYDCVAAVARERSTGYRFAIKADMRRDNITGQLQRVWSFFDVFGPGAGRQYGYEDNGFQVMMGKSFDAMREARQKDGLTFTCTLTGYTSTENKNDRISRLAPDADNGWIELDEEIPVEVLEQFRQIPTGTHDDGPDAIERADWLVCGGGSAQATLKGRLPGG